MTATQTNKLIGKDEVLKPIYIEHIKENIQRFSLEDITFSWDSFFTDKEIDNIIEKDQDIKELNFMIKYEIASFYNRKLEERFRDDPETAMSFIYKRSFVNEFLNNLSNVSKSHKYFRALISSGIITTCGSGYLFDGGRIEITEEERKRAVKLKFKL